MTEVLTIGEQDVLDLLPMNECIGAMRSAFEAVARGAFVQPQRLAVWKPDRSGAIAAMPAFLDSGGGTVGAKLITIFPQNRAAGLPSHQGVVALFDADSGALQALLHAGAIAAIRTAAVSALATGYLARKDAKSLALIGSGEQAHSHLAAMRQVRNITEVRIWSRNHEHAQAFAAAVKSSSLRIVLAGSVREAVRDPDIICTLTPATAPILEGAWLEPGVHVNAVGSSVPPFRELDTDAVTRSRVFIDHREAALREADDLRIPIAEGAISESDICGDLAELVSRRVQGRRSADEITLFKSVGMAIEDLAAARYVYERSLAKLGRPSTSSG